VVTDFVDCLEEAFHQSNDKSLGPDFDFKEWCDQWLHSSGINTLEPVLKFSDDGKQLKSFKVKQGLDLRGKNRLRKQKLDIAIFGQE